MYLEMLSNHFWFLNYYQGPGKCQFGTLELRSALQCIQVMIWLRSWTLWSRPYGISSSIFYSLPLCGVVHNLVFAIAPPPPPAPTPPPSGGYWFATYWWMERGEYVYWSTPSLPPDPWSNQDPVTRRLTNNGPTSVPERSVPPSPPLTPSPSSPRGGISNTFWLVPWQHFRMGEGEGIWTSKYILYCI